MMWREVSRFRREHMPDSSGELANTGNGRRWYEAKGGECIVYKWVAE